MKSNINQNNCLNNNEKYIIDSLVYNNISQVFSIIYESINDKKDAIKIFYQLIFDAYSLSEQEFNLKFSHDFELIKKNSTNNDYQQLLLVLDPIKKINQLLSKNISLIKGLNLDKFRKVINIDYCSIIADYIETKLFKFIESLFSLKERSGLAPKEYKERVENMIESFNPECEHKWLDEFKTVCYINQL